MLLAAWRSFAALVLLLSLAVHASTFLGIDPTDKFRGVMFIHIAIFPPFIAAIVYASKVPAEVKDRQQRTMSAAPRLLQALTGLFFAYAIVNFIIFIIISQ